jgi:hypothetical protein
VIQKKRHKRDFNWLCWTVHQEKQEIWRQILYDASSHKHNENYMAKKAAKVTTEAEARAQSIENLTAAFLKSGGKIQEIPNGVSGQTSLSGSKHITIEKKSTA